uniref:Uncharacterized protein n=1 Tax=Sphaerodactylus townsendi TaxID=933632 RepID=A0ACB8F6I3_9SAUR
MKSLRTKGPPAIDPLTLTGWRYTFTTTFSRPQDPNRKATLFLHSRNAKLLALLFILHFYFTESFSVFSFIRGATKRLTVPSPPTPPPAFLPLFQEPQTKPASLDEGYSSLGPQIFLHCFQWKQGGSLFGGFIKLDPLTQSSSDLGGSCKESHLQLCCKCGGSKLKEKTPTQSPTK